MDRHFSESFNILSSLTASSLMKRSGSGLECFWVWRLSLSHIFKRHSMWLHQWIYLSNTGWSVASFMYIFWTLGYVSVNLAIYGPISTAQLRVLTMVARDITAVSLEELSFRIQISTNWLQFWSRSTPTKLHSWCNWRLGIVLKRSANWTNWLMSAYVNVDCCTCYVKWIWRITCATVVMFFGLTLSNVVTYFILMDLYICCPAYKRFILSCLCCILTCRCPTYMLVNMTTNYMHWLKMITVL